MTYEQAIESEARRLNERYVREVVEHFGLCPWAARATREGRVKTLILQQNSPDSFEPSLERIAELAADSSLEIGLLVYPRLEVSRLEFEHFVRQLMRLDADRHDVAAMPFASAAFHPDAPADTGDAERLIPFLRRTPDPTLQLVRHSVLDRVRGQTSEGTEFFDMHLLTAENLPKRKHLSVSAQVARTNRETVLEAGASAIEAVLSDIRADRDRTYRALAERRAAGML